MATKPNSQSAKIKIKLLTDAKQYLSLRSNYTGLCYALERATQYTSAAEPKAMYELKDYIRKSLGTSSWLQSWMYRKGLDTNPKAVYEARLAWIDWMIECLEGKR